MSSKYHGSKLQLDRDKTKLEVRGFFLPCPPYSFLLLWTYIFLDSDVKGADRLSEIKPCFTSTFHHLPHYPQVISVDGFYEVQICFNSTTIRQRSEVTNTSLFEYNLASFKSQRRRKLSEFSIDFPHHFKTNLTSLINEVKWNANLMQQGNFIGVSLARHVSGTYAHHQEN